MGKDRSEQKRLIYKIGKRRMRRTFEPERALTSSRTMGRVADDRGGRSVYARGVTAGHDFHIQIAFEDDSRRYACTRVRGSAVLSRLTAARASREINTLPERSAIAVLRIRLNWTFPSLPCIIHAPRVFHGLAYLRKTNGIWKNLLFKYLLPEKWQEEGSYFILFYSRVLNDNYECFLRRS